MLWRGKGLLGLSPEMEVLVDTNSVLSIYLASTSTGMLHWCVLALYSPPALLKPVDTCSPHRRYPLGIGSGELGTCTSGSHGTETIKETFPGRLPPPRAWKRRRRKRRRRRKLWFIYLSYNFSMRGRLQKDHTSRGYGGALRECRPGTPSLHPAFALLHLVGTSQKRVYILEPWFSQLSLRAHIQTA